MDFSLIETLRWQPGTGFQNLDLHMQRLQKSARALGFAGAETAADALAAHVRSFEQPHRVRLELSAGGSAAITSAPFTLQPETAVWTIRIASARLASNDPLLQHKTSRRQAYTAARAEYSTDEADEVVLLNEKGELCEGTITSLFVDDGDGTLLTPPLSCGLLAGVLRGLLLSQKKAREQTLFPADLTGKTLYMGNSLRGLIRAEAR